MQVLIDKRWDGDTGIGKVYREIISRSPPDVSTSFVESRMGLGNAFTPVMLAAEIGKSRADVFYSPSFMPPLYSRIPFVFTIHDLMHLFYYSKWHRLYYKQVIAKLATKAKRIITVSYFTKQQLIELLGIDEQLITVIYNGVDDRFWNNAEVYTNERPYFFYLGNQRKNKNLPGMLAAFARAAIPPDFMFLLTGEPSAVLNQHIKDLGIINRVRFLGYIPEAELPALYKGAYATLYVSLMEGFGLPVIESMASGTPVLTSTAGALPEISGGAALCVNPLDIDAIANGIEQLVDDGVLYQRYTQLGYDQARRFSWGIAAQKTWETILVT